MNIFYKVWLLCYRIMCKYSTNLEQFFFFSRPEQFYNNLSIFKMSYFQKFILFLFFTPLNMKKITAFLMDTHRIYEYRIVKYTIISIFFSKEAKNYEFAVINSKCKNSILKLNFEIESDKKENFRFISNMYLILNEIKFLTYWTKIDYKNTLETYLTQNYSFVLYNNRNWNGLVHFLSKDSHQHSAFKIKKLDKFNNKVVSILKEPKKIMHRRSKRIPLLTLIEKYNSIYKEAFFTKFKDLSYSTHSGIFLTFLKIKNITFEKNFLSFYKKLYLIKYKPTDNSSKLNPNKASALFLRKNKIFNKGRYSRNRQLYRTGVYWCLWLNIINVFGLYYYFYRFVFNFGYFYIPMLILILSIFGSRLVKYRFYNPMNIINEFIMFIKIMISFCTEIVFNFFIRTKDIIVYLAKKLYKYVLSFFK